MGYFLLGIGIGILIASVVNSKFRKGEPWIKTRTLIWLGVAVVVLVLSNWLAGSSLLSIGEP